MIQNSMFHTPIGTLRIQSDNNVITALEYGDFSPAVRKVSLGSAATPFWKAVGKELEGYFFSAQSAFSLPCNPRGTVFQQRVWQALKTIPRGEVLTYGQLARQLDSHPRAIGMACRKNPIPLLIPCHRVVAATGLGGFAGQTRGPLIELKKWLLQHESHPADLSQHVVHH